MKALKEIPNDYEKLGYVLLPPKDDDQFRMWNYRLGNRPGKHIPQDVLMTMADHFTLPTITDGLDTCNYVDPFRLHKEITDIQEIFGHLRYMKGVVAAYKEHEAKRDYYLS
ncbi:hypothetical protein SmphiM12_483 [Sinorhizobium phage phiM12]|uniref:Uncharacterized protein n=1 Tax=Sinorhizobium phage phiM12 TaxID=1357423 RepID=S5MQH0_9CAUD|nr:hypothetical protein AB690_gp141 [Sinorhizobium phage phiM12]AGR48115.2 hypothetical protein SmphiM12_483 [Sinorhizobium phage phiM12]